MKRSFTVFTALLIMLTQFMSPAAAFSDVKTDIYVSAAGSDLNDGSKNSPLKSVGAAKEKLKTLKNEYSGATVHIAEGTYTFDDTLYFTSDDMPNVTFEGNGYVRFSGSFEITDFTEETVNGITVFTKQFTSPMNFRSLFNGEDALPTPRYPETGYFTVKATDPENDLWTEDNTPWSLCLGQRSFFADKDDVVCEFTNPEDMVIRILHYWHDEIMTVTDIDRSTGKISLSRPSTMLIRDIDRFYFENVFEAMNEPGEWYLDKKTNKLFYVPHKGETADKTVLCAPSVSRLIDINGVDGISFRNIRFENTDWSITENSDNSQADDWRTENNIDAPQAAFDVPGVVTAKYAENINIKNCEFMNLGADGIKLMQGVKHSSVENCYFENIAATGIFAGGENCLPEGADYMSDITIRNNEVYKYGRKFFCAIGIHITYCDTAIVENNEIHDGYYTGISCGWVWGYSYHATKNIIIKNNLIYNIGQGWLSDMGGIYTLGIQPGTVLSGNVIHNVAADPGEGGYGGWGIYLDEGSSQILVEKNLVFACGNDGYHLHYGKDNTVRNNIFALNANSQMRAVSREEGHNTANITGNILLTSNNTPVLSSADKTCTVVENNYFYSISGDSDIFVTEGDINKAMSLKTAERKGFIGQNMIADPAFTDAASFDFTFSEGSKVVELGFEPWDCSVAGTVTGSVIGIDRVGGTTAYNDNAAPQEFTGSKEKLPFINAVINRLAELLSRLSYIFRQLFGNTSVC